MACSAWARSWNSTNAKPRGRPVSRSTGRTICVGGAMVPKYVRRSASVVPYDRLPTNKRTANQLSPKLEEGEGQCARRRARTHGQVTQSAKTLPEVDQHGKRCLR